MPSLPTSRHSRPSWTGAVDVRGFHDTSGLVCRVDKLQTAYAIERVVDLKQKEELQVQAAALQ